MVSGWMTPPPEAELCPVCNDTHEDWEDLCACFHKLVAQVDEDWAAIREVDEMLTTGAMYPKSARLAGWREKHAAAIARATGQEGAR